jgi:hypothetical protein
LRQGQNKWFSGLAVVAIFLGFGSSQTVEARSSRVNQVPNGTVIGCATCHVDPAGGGTRNDFGKQVEANFLTAFDFTGQVMWGAELAALDADGDGVSNGAELGDPDGVWNPGDDAGDPDLATRPGDAASTRTITAVMASSWAEVKSFFGSNE